MNFEEYQVEVQRTAMSSGGEGDRVIRALGIATEAGEVIDLVKKFEEQGKTYELERMADELGDLLWYLTAMAEDHDLTLEDIAEKNVKKLKKRFPGGWQPGGGIR